MYMKIHPSLLAADLSNIQKEVASVIHKNTKSLHFDIGDNQFVPSYMLREELLKKIPQDVPIDAHLMVKYPSKYIPNILKYTQIQSIAFHIEIPEDIRSNIIKIHESGREVGLAILPSTPSNYLDQYLLEIDYILIMTVMWGFSGTPFIPEMLEKIKEIHQKAPEITIIVDGGITLETATLCAKMGVTEAVIWSALFWQKDRKDYLEKLSKI